MLKIITKQRKTSFLTPSGLRCLANLPTVNISAGCANNCVYCYTKGYSVYPGDGLIVIYENMAERIVDEIKRRKPTTVYFCPSCDPFQPVPEIQQITLSVMKILLENNIGVQFVTKGKMAEEFFILFEKHSSKIAGQIGLTTIDDKILSVIEPDAAKAYERLGQIERLMKIGVKMSVRCDPLIYGITDEDKQLNALFSSVAKAGCKEVAVSYLFLRPAIISSLKKNIFDADMLDKILKPFSDGITLPIGTKNSTGTVLPWDIRKLAFERIKKIAKTYDITIHICGCKNSDITNERCHITCEQIDPMNGLF